MQDQAPGVSGEDCKPDNDLAVKATEKTEARPVAEQLEGLWQALNCGDAFARAHLYY
jgi:hypothetical protein